MEPGFCGKKPTRGEGEGDYPYFGDLVRNLIGREG